MEPKRPTKTLKLVQSSAKWDQSTDNPIAHIKRPGGMRVAVELIEKPFKTAKVANVLSGNYPETILNLSGMGVVSTWGRARIKSVKEIH